jgi:hypothetical protein
MLHWLLFLSRVLSRSEIQIQMLNTGRKKRKGYAEDAEKRQKENSMKSCDARTVLTCTC